MVHTTLIVYLSSNDVKMFGCRGKSDVAQLFNLVIKNIVDESALKQRYILT